MVYLILKYKIFYKVIIVSAAILLIATVMFIVMKKDYSKTIANNINTLEQAFSSSQAAAAKTGEAVEIFDIGQGKVVKKIQIDKTILAQAQSLLQSVTGLYPKVKAFPEKGHIIKIPFEPEVKIDNPLFNDYAVSSINKVYIILPEDNSPYLMVLNSVEKPYFYCFNQDIDRLLKSLSFEIEGLNHRLR